MAEAGRLHLRQHFRSVARLTNVTRALCIWLSLLAFETHPLGAQAPKVGEINLYGLRKLSAEKVLAVLEVKPGDPMPASRGDLEDRLDALPGVVRTRVQAMCCEGNTAVLFAGIEEKGGAHFAYRSEPTGSAVLPKGLLDTYRNFTEAVAAATRRGSTAEDLTEGHSLMADTTARGIQLAFASYAGEHVRDLREVLRNSSEAEQRAIAAIVIGYAPHKREVVDDLLYAVQDPDDAVRATAMRSLTAIAVLAVRRPDLQLKIPPTWFVEMLNSIELSDRLKAVETLVVLTGKDGADVLELLRARALPALVEMARWKTLRFAVGPFLLVGRVAGLPEAEIHARWEKGNREAVIEQAMGEPKPRRHGESKP
jgi:hypothetical protein